MSINSGEDQIKQVLATFFDFLSTFQHQNSVDAIKSKTFNSFWELLFGPLLMFGVVEKDYYSLFFLDPKLIKNDNTTKLYHKIASQLSENSKLFRVHQYSSTIDNSFFIALMSQVILIVTVRIDLINMYKVIASYRGAPVYNGWLDTLETVSLLISNKITNIFLERMKDNILKEVKILIALFKAQEAMVTFNVKDSTLLLYQAKLDIGHWIRLNGRVQKELLYVWISRFHSSMLSKHSLYFYHINQNYELTVDSKKPITPKPEFTNYYNTFVKFCQTNGCANISIVFDVNGIFDIPPQPIITPTTPSQQSLLQSDQLNLENKEISKIEGKPQEIKEDKTENKEDSKQQPQLQPCTYHCEPQIGYVLDLEPVGNASGLASWPAIVSAPHMNAPKEHWPSVVSLIMDNIDFLNRYKEPIHCFDKTNMSTYYCAKLDRRMYLILIYNKKKDQNDSTIKELLYTLTTNLRNWKIFSLLVPKNY